jgi:hypothetical protein
MIAGLPPDAAENRAGILALIVVIVIVIIVVTAAR